MFSPIPYHLMAVKEEDERDINIYNTEQTIATLANYCLIYLLLNMSYNLSTIVLGLVQSTFDLLNKIDVYGNQLLLVAIILNSVMFTMIFILCLEELGNLVVKKVGEKLECPTASK